MKTQIRAVTSINSVNSYSIRPIIGFTDWNGGNAVTDKPENRDDDELLDFPTMEMGNRTEIGYDDYEGSPPSGEYVIKGKTLYERLDSHNRDNFWQYRDEVVTSESLDKDFKIYLIMAFASEVDLTPLQKQKAFKRFLGLDLPRATGRAELNAFLICSLIANEGAEEFGSEKVYHPQRSPENNDEAFRRLEKALRERFPRITTSSLTSVYNKLSQDNPPTRHPSKWKGAFKQEFIECDE